MAVRPARGTGKSVSGVPAMKTVLRGLIGSAILLRRGMGAMQAVGMASAARAAAVAIAEKDISGLAIYAIGITIIRTGTAGFVQTVPPASGLAARSGMALRLFTGGIR